MRQRSPGVPRLAGQGTPGTDPSLRAAPACGSCARAAPGDGWSCGSSQPQGKQLSTRRTRLSPAVGSKKQLFFQCLTLRGICPCEGPPCPAGTDTELTRACVLTKDIPGCPARPSRDPAVTRAPSCSFQNQPQLLFSGGPVLVKAVKMMILSTLEGFLQLTPTGLTTTRDGNTQFWVDLHQTANTLHRGDVHQCHPTASAFARCKRSPDRNF